MAFPHAAPVPPGLRLRIDDAVHQHLAAELGRRQLLLPRAVDDAATARALAHGAHLLRRLAGDAVVVVDDERTRERIHLGLAFGAVTGTLLASTEPPPQTQLLCAVFNLGIGLIDGLCDGSRPAGLAVLGAVEAADLRWGARQGWPPAAVRRALPPRLGADVAVAFAARLVETFVELLHAVHPGGPGLPVRERVGERLEDALAAERTSVDRGGIDPSASSAEITARLHDCSRATSVLPFQIIELIVGGEPGADAGRNPGRSPGIAIGEAMWRIDDLVDLADDAAAGCVNSLLVCCPTTGWRRARPGPMSTDDLLVRHAADRPRLFWRHSSARTSSAAPRNQPPPTSPTACARLPGTCRALTRRGRSSWPSSSGTPALGRVADPGAPAVMTSDAGQRETGGLPGRRDDPIADLLGRRHPGLLG